MKSIKRIKYLEDYFIFEIAKKEGDYAELLDESDENSDVVLRRKNGSPFIMMPRDLWDELRNSPKYR